MRKSFLAVPLAFALGAAGLLAACGGDDNSPPAKSATIATAPTTPKETLQPVVKVSQSSSLGQVLTDTSGRTLYIYTKDVVGSGKSVCNGPCATAWPPLMSTGDQVVKPDGLPGEFSVVMRDDGTKMVAYNGQPLYYYAKDAAPGDTNGQAVGNVWYVVPPGTAAVLAPSPAQPSVKVAQAGTFGQVLTGPDGRTLYIYTKDLAGSGKSVCNGACATAWPPLVATSNAAVKPDGLPGELSVVTRDDGTKMVAYNGQPLYYYAKDAAPGDTNGQAVGNVWYVVPPSASASSGGSADTTPAGASAPPAAPNTVAASTSSGNSSNAAPVEAAPAQPAPELTPTPSLPAATSAPSLPPATATPHVQPTAHVEPTPYSTAPYGAY